MAIPINIEDLLNKQKIESNNGCGDTVILNVPHDVPHDVPHNEDLDKWIEEQIAKNPNITTQELADLCQRSSKTIKRHILKLSHIQYKGSGSNGYWEIKTSDKNK